MKRTYQWKGLFYDSREECTVTALDSGIQIESMITGQYKDVAYGVTYRIRADRTWVPLTLELTQTCNGKTKTLHAFHEKSGWLINRKPHPEFESCSHIDISVTPLTNTFPINNLNLESGNSQQVNVLYIDVLNDDIRATRQQYMKKSATIYNFQTVPNDFEADIHVDSDGFVILYPELFERIPF